MADQFTNASGAAQSAPATRHFAITLSDTVDMAIVPRALYVLTAGNLAIVDAADVVVVYPVTAGQIIPFRGKRINLASSTATAVGWY